MNIKTFIFLSTQQKDFTISSWAEILKSQFNHFLYAKACFLCRKGPMETLLVWIKYAHNNKSASIEFVAPSPFFLDGIILK